MAVVDTKRKMLGEMLVAAGLIKDEQLKKALEEQKKRGGKVGEVLVDLGFITEHDLATFLREGEATTLDDAVAAAAAKGDAT